MIEDNNENLNNQENIDTEYNENQAENETVQPEQPIYQPVQQPYQSQYVPNNAPYGFDPELYLEKRDIKRKANTIGIPCICLSFVGIIWSMLYVFLTTKVVGMTLEEAIQLSENPAFQQILQIILSCFMFFIPFTLAAKIAGYRIDRLILFGKVQKNKILPFLFFGMGFCSFANIATNYASAIFESIGMGEYNVPDMQNPEGIFGFILTFIATAIVPALIEEFACRGIVLGILKKYGDGFAIITSAIVFGVMHGNFEQIPFAIIVGLILGYIYVKTQSIWICVAVHCINNAVSVIFSYLENIIPVNIQNVMYIVYLMASMILAVLGIYLLSKNSQEEYELEKCDNKATTKQKYTWFFTGWSIIVFVVFNLLEALSYFIQWESF